MATMVRCDGPLICFISSYDKMVKKDSIMLWRSLLASVPLGQLAVDMSVFTALVFSCLASLSWARTDPSQANNPIVADSAEIQDIVGDDTQDFLNQWKAACATPGQSTVTVPAGKTITLNPINLEGPCKSSNIHVQITGTIMAPNYIGAWNGKDRSHWIKIHNVNGLTIDGSGHIDGQGQVWWDCRNKGQCSEAPTALGILNSNNVVVRDLKFLNSGGKHLLIYKSTSAHLSQLSITAPKESPNTDGISISSSQHVKVTSSTIGTGDDCVGIIGDGSSDVNISQIACGPGHGISIGSLGSGGSHAEVSQIHISNCQFYQTMFGARIKTDQGGSGFAKDITFQQLNFTAADEAISIDQYYCNGAHNCPNKTGAVQVSNVKFIGLQGTSTNKVPITLACSESVACTGIVLDHVLISAATPGTQQTSYCFNAFGTKVPPVVPAVSCLS